MRKTETNFFRAVSVCFSSPRPSPDAFRFGSWRAQACSATAQVTYRVSSLNARPLVTHTQPKFINFSIKLISTNMDPIEAALASFELLKLGEKPNYSATAKKFGCCRSTLSKRHRGVQGVRTELCTTTPIQPKRCE
ncbi:uncharacterized protein BDR25DRAFT_363948 [Lindgomyces ingoldianus]|uniref:Uncharacterized protein n=1 Tax=Lindgomyces ingoldianus TaxID=673940 RepID=A0ACB6Q7F6_9PLEO|nr:uncharacterized protein BDR25DRAFT_363948 [Lindgomyces ingoldianus]KAF2462533.1 hypothetical protein BDR25DRAFT_363948 [Lindgomyces ingoldianus]